MNKPAEARQVAGLSSCGSAIAVLLSLASATAGSQARPAASVEPAVAGRQTAADSAKYVQDSIKWVRDSVVIDSIARTIKPDSLYRLLRAQLHARDPLPIQVLIGCEIFRLEFVYGTNAAQDVVQRVRDTVYAKTDSTARWRLAMQLGFMSYSEMASAVARVTECVAASHWGPHAPESVGGTPLSRRAARPVRGQRVSADPAASTGWSDDSARYVRDSIKWVRDSVVIDSISRTINTDSLYRLYRAQLRADNPVPLQRAIECESFRPYWLYGSNAAYDVNARMRDTLYRKTDSADMRRVAKRLSEMSIEEMASLGVGQRQCGRFSLWGPHHPATIDGTSLDTRTGRPAKPQRPPS